MRRVLAFFSFAGLAFCFLPVLFSGDVSYASDSARKGTGKYIQFESEPESVRVLNAGSYVGTTPFKYEFPSLYEVDREFVFQKCGYAVSLYWIPEPDPIEHNIVSTMVGSWFQGKKYFPVHTGTREKPGKTLLVTSKVNVKLEKLPEGGSKLTTALARGNEEDRAYARHVLEFMLPLEGCYEQQTFLKSAGVAHALFGDTDAGFRKLASLALDRASWSPPDSNEYIYYLFAAQDWQRLGDTRSRAVEPLMTGLRDADADIRKASQRTLVAVGQPAIRELEQNLADKREGVQVREACAEALGSIGDPSAVASLTNALKTDNEVRSKAAIALAGLGSSARQALLDALVDDDRNVRIAVLYPLGILGSKDAGTVEGLIRLLQNAKTESDRMFAAIALAEVGPPAEKAVPVLVDVFPLISGTKDIRVEVGGSLTEQRASNAVAEEVKGDFKEYGYDCLAYVNVLSSQTTNSTVHSSISGVDQGVSTQITGIANWQFGAGAYALSRITGERWTTKDEWRTWWQRRQTK